MLLAVFGNQCVGGMNFAEGLLSNTVDWIEKGYKARCCI